MSKATKYERALSLLTWRAPLFAKKVLPPGILHRLRSLRARLLSVGLPRHMEFVQAMEDAVASASVSIVVTIHDAPAVTRRCLASLEEYAPKSEIVLVDDGSVLSETSELIHDFSIRNGWKVVRHEKSLGHSRACEAGARLATRPYLCLLNSDTVVTPWCWRTLNEAFEVDARIGVAGPSSSYAGNAQTVPVAEYCRHYWNDSQISAFARRLLDCSPEPGLVDLPWAGGFALFIRRTLWEELEGFDCNLPDYGNEVEFCRRAVNMGYRTVWVRQSYIHHLGQQSYENTIGEREIELRRAAARQYISEEHTARKLR